MPTPCAGAPLELAQANVLEYAETDVLPELLMQEQREPAETQMNA